MKTKSVLSVILGCGMLACGLTASAQNNGPAQDVQMYDARFNLAATPDAPQGAKGKAEIRSDTQDGSQTSTLAIQTQKLDAGDYTVSGTFASDGSTADLGTITVDDSGNGKGKGKNNTEIDLGPYMDSRDITQLDIVNSDGVTVLSGDLSGKSKAIYNATVPITPGDAAPDATGFAKLRSRVSKGTVKNSFILNASGVPESSTFTVLVDGTEAGTVNSNNKGKVLVKKLPSDITSIGTVSLVDETGTEVLSASF